MAKGGIGSRLGGSRLGQKLEQVADAGKAVRRTASKAKAGAKDVPPPSPNPMTNLIIADLVLRGGGRLLRNLVERNVLKAKYPPATAKSIVSGRGMAQTLISTAVARVATRSVPGAILVGGGLLAKALYDRRKGAEAKEKGKQAVARRVAKGS
jgi:hypothetical protein